MHARDHREELFWLRRQDRLRIESDLAPQRQHALGAGVIIDEVSDVLGQYQFPPVDCRQRLGRPRIQLKQRKHAFERESHRDIIACLALSGRVGAAGVRDDQMVDIHWVSENLGDERN